MKELSIEEKAKRYNEAIEIARKINNGDDVTAAPGWTTYEVIFPELRESEDEIIRKELIKLMKKMSNTIVENYTTIEISTFISWLEKQDEQNPTDKVEPKFKVGDWITFYGGEPFKILKIEAEQNGILDYLLLGQNGHDSYYNKKYVDENVRLWTIQDAKDGDVLAFNDETIVIFKDSYNSTTFHSYCHIEEGAFNVSQDNMPDLWNGKGFHPATKEQYDLLFQKMKEACYEWNAEKKELKKIEPNPAWSEDDENRFNNLIYLVEHSDEGKGTKEGFVKFINRLKSLKERYTWKPSDEQLDALHDAAEYVDKSIFPYSKRILMKLYKQIKELREE